MTAYGISPVGPEGAQWDRAQVIEIPSRAELWRENQRLRALLVETVAAREAWHDAWRHAVNGRIGDRERLSRAARVLASLGRLSPRMAAVVECSRREIWRLDE